MQSPKQELARRHNWDVARIRGAIELLKGLCVQNGLSGTAAALMDIGTKIEKANKKRFERERAKL
jgi:hypothetical protein